MMILKWGEGGEVDTSLQTMMKKKDIYKPRKIGKQYFVKDCNKKTT